MSIVKETILSKVEVINKRFRNRMQRLQKLEDEKRKRIGKLDSKIDVLRDVATQDEKDLIELLGACIKQDCSMQEISDRMPGVEAHCISEMIGEYYGSKVAETPSSKGRP
jgi:hypothetical protein